MNKRNSLNISQATKLVFIATKHVKWFIKNKKYRENLKLSFLYNTFIEMHFVCFRKQSSKCKQPIFFRSRTIKVPKKQRLKDFKHKKYKVFHRKCVENSNCCWTAIVLLCDLGSTRSQTIASIMLNFLYQI